MSNNTNPQKKSRFATPSHASGPGSNVRSQLATDSESKKNAAGTGTRTVVSSFLSNTTKGILLKDTYEKLHALGMPSSITLEAFQRIVLESDNSGGSESDKVGPGGSRSANASSNSGIVPVQRTNSPDSNTTGKKGAKTSPTSVDDSSVRPVNKLRDGLEFLSVHLVGRQEARRARGMILKFREEHINATASKMLPTSRIKAPSTASLNAIDIFSDPREEASRKRDSANRGLEAARAEYDSLSKSLHSLESRKADLSKELEVKRRVLLFLDILEKRENARLRRLGYTQETDEEKGLGTLVRESREELKLTAKELQSVVSDTRNLNNSKKYEKQIFVNFKYPNTTEVLANLHAWHVRQIHLKHRIWQTVQSKDKLTNEKNLSSTQKLERILKRLGVHGEKASKMKNALVIVAQRRAERKLFAIPRHKLQEERVNLGDLENLEGSISLKGKLVQEKINHHVALGWLCEEYIDMISTFRTETTGELSSMLREHGERVEGFVDKIRVRIVQTGKSSLRKSKAANQETFEGQVREILSTERLDVCEDVRGLMRTVGASEAVMRDMNQIQNVNANVANHAIQTRGLAESAKLSVDVESDRVLKLLERKAKKAEHGFHIVEEIRKLLADSKKLR